jgi:hypothetical protein
MCERKPSQTFFQDGAAAEVGRVLLTGAGVLTDLLSTGPITAATTPLLILRDGASSSGRILVSLSPTAQHFFGGMNLEFEQGLWLEYTPGAGPAFGKFTVAGYIADDSPDQLGIQMERLREAVTGLTSRLAALVDGLLHGDPAA